MYIDGVNQDNKKTFSGLVKVIYQVFQNQPVLVEDYHNELYL